MALGPQMDPVVIRLANKVLRPVIYLTFEGYDIEFGMLIDKQATQAQSGIVAVEYIAITRYQYGSFEVEIGIIDSTFIAFDRIISTLKTSKGIRFFLRYGWTEELSETLTGYLVSAEPTFDGAMGIKYVCKCNGLSVIANTGNVKSRTYKNKKISDIVRLIAIEAGFGNKVSIEETEGVIDSVTMPDGMGLMTFIKTKLINLSVSKERGLSDYKLYETLGGYLHFHAPGYRNIPGYDRIYDYNTSGGKSDLQSYEPTPLSSISLKKSLGESNQSAATINPITKEKHFVQAVQNETTGEVQVTTSENDIIINKPDFMKPVPYKGTSVLLAETKGLLARNNEVFSLGQITLTGDVYLEPLSNIKIDVNTPAGRVESLSGSFEITSVNDRVDNTNFITTCSIRKLTEFERKTVEGTATSYRERRTGR